MHSFINQKENNCDNCEIEMPKGEWVWIDDDKTICE